MEGYVKGNLGVRTSRYILFFFLFGVTICSNLPGTKLPQARVCVASGKSNIYLVAT